jgi:hypothetical protein
MMMSKQLSSIPNKVKQPAQCCIHCGKSYSKRTSLDKHIVLCELIHRSKKSSLIIEEDEHIPSQRKMYQMLLELGIKYNKLDEKVSELNKWVIKKKKKINVLEWLNANMIPDFTFDNLYETVKIGEEDIKNLLDNSFIETINEIFSKWLYNINEEQTEDKTEDKTEYKTEEQTDYKTEDKTEYKTEDKTEDKKKCKLNNDYTYYQNIKTNIIPIVAFVQKTSRFYVYDGCVGEEKTWKELSKDKLIKFLVKIQMKLAKTFYNWKKQNQTEIRENDSLSIICDKASIKLMSVDFKQESTLSKIRSALYNKMKSDIKALIEYEFEF